MNASPEEARGFRHTGARVSGGCSVLYMNDGKQTWVLCEISGTLKCFLDAVPKLVGQSTFFINNYFMCVHVYLPK